MPKITTINKVGKFKQHVDTYHFDETENATPFTELGIETGTYGGWKSKLTLAVNVCQKCLDDNGYNISSVVIKNEYGYTILL